MPWRHWDRCENGMGLGRRPTLGKLTVSCRNWQINIVISACLEASFRCCRNTCASNLSVEREVTLDRHMYMEVWGGRIKSKKRQHVWMKACKCEKAWCSGNFQLVQHTLSRGQRTECRVHSRALSVMREKLKAQGRTRELACRSNKMVLSWTRRSERIFR